MVAYTGGFAKKNTAALAPKAKLQYTLKLLCSLRIFLPLGLVGHMFVYPLACLLNVCTGIELIQRAVKGGSIAAKEFFYIHKTLVERNIVANVGAALFLGNGIAAWLFIFKALVKRFSLILFAKTFVEAAAFFFLLCNAGAGV